MNTLKNNLIKNGKTRWLDIGTNKNFEKGFLYVDIFPKSKIPKENRSNYNRLNILRAKRGELLRMGTFDFVRMQHVIEHFDFEDAIKVLRNTSLLLKKGGLLLITVPDLKKNIKEYLRGHHKYWPKFLEWAQKRISKDAPPSFYFSIFAHSLSTTRHRWCYDINGLIYVINSAKKYHSVKELDIRSPESSIPFTHNRPEEDLCVLAVKK